MNYEPAIATMLTSVIFTWVVAAGIPLTKDQLVGVVSAVLVVGYWFVRQRVTPVKKLQDNNINPDNLQTKN